MITEQQSICSLLCVCQSLRAAVQQCQSGVIQLQLQRRQAVGVEWLEKVADFAGWLPKHPGLVGDVTIRGDTSQQAGSTGRYHVAASLLAFSFQQAAGQLSQPWKLETNILSKQMLLALPPASLTALHFCNTKWGDWSALSPSLSRLTGLKQLTLKFDSCKVEPMPGSLLHQVAQLQSLTWLKLGCINDDCDLQLLPLQLQDLQIVCCESQPLLTILCHLTLLQRVKFRWSSDTAEDTQQLQHMAPQLNQLQHVALADPNLDSLIETASILKLVPNLRSLELGMESDFMPFATFQQLMQQLAEATALINLIVDAPLEEDDRMPYDAAHLTGLVNLQHLRIHGVCVTQAAVQQLAQLTALTSIEVDVMDDGVLTLLALKLTNLQSLQVLRSSVGIGPMPAVGQLTKLRALSVLMHEADIAKRALCYLTNLRQLRLLCGFSAAGQEALDAFCSAVDSGVSCI